MNKLLKLEKSIIENQEDLSQLQDKLEKIMQEDKTSTFNYLAYGKKKKELENKLNDYLDKRKEKIDSGMALKKSKKINMFFGILGSVLTSIPYLLLIFSSFVSILNIILFIPLSLLPGIFAIIDYHEKKVEYKNLKKKAPVIEGKIEEITNQLSDLDCYLERELEINNSLKTEEEKLNYEIQVKQTLLNKITYILNNIKEAVIEHFKNNNELQGKLNDIYEQEIGNSRLLDKKCK